MFAFIAAAHGAVVAVGGFDVASVDPSIQPLGTSLAHMLTTDLDDVRGVILVERTRIDEVLAELDLSQSAYIDPNTAQQSGRLVGAEQFVVGSITSEGTALRIDARIVDVETATVLHSLEVSGDRNAFFALEADLAEGLARGLQRTSTSRARARQQQRLAGTLEGAVAYGRALELAATGEREAAIRAVDVAIADNARFSDAQTLLLELTQRDLIYVGASVAVVQNMKLYDESAPATWALNFEAGMYFGRVGPFVAGQITGLGGSTVRSDFGYELSAYEESVNMGRGRIGVKWEATQWGTTYLNAVGYGEWASGWYSVHLGNDLLRAERLNRFGLGAGAELHHLMQRQTMGLRLGAYYTAHAPLPAIERASFDRRTGPGGFEVQLGYTLFVGRNLIRVLFGGRP